MLEYPNKLNTIFDKLKKFNIKPILVGGFVRDSFLQINSKDIDIELYNAPSFEKTEEILREFGNTNIIGKSFGVIKLNIDNLDIDFSLPRLDNKVSEGHKGFKVTTSNDLDFKTASFRRDFTMNAIGYDVYLHKFLDYYNGIDDLKDKKLRFIDEGSFKEDPLRVLRAVQFCARFNLEMDLKLFATCKDMVKDNLLDELPTERIFQEIKKLLLKSDTPSIGLKLLKDLDINLFQIDTDKLKNIDNFIRFKTTNDRTNLVILLALLYKDTQYDIDKLTNSKSLSKDISLLLHVADYFDNKTDKILYAAAKDIDINILALFLKVLHVDNERVRTLNSVRPVIDGKDLINLGIKPSKEYSLLLQSIYEAQLRGEKTIYLPILELSISITV